MVNPEATEAFKQLPIITSEAEPIQVDFLLPPVIGRSGRLGMTHAPGKQNLGMRAQWRRDLRQDLDRIQACYQADWLITLLEPHELALLHIPDLFEQIKARGIRSHQFPIPDFGVPRSQQSLLELVQFIFTQLEAGQTVVLHCRAGLGRTGMVAAAYLVTQGYSAEAAFAEVRRSRPGCIETPEQEAFVSQFAQTWTAPFDRSA